MFWGCRFSWVLWGRMLWRDNERSTRYLSVSKLKFLPYHTASSHTYWVYLAVRNRMLRNTGFFLGAWAFHYFPFYLMNRQLFLHHYLPAHLASALVAGSTLNFVLTETVNYPISKAGLKTRLRPVVRARTGKVGVVVVAALLAAVVGTFWFLKPLTYGTPS